MSGKKKSLLSFLTDEVLIPSGERMAEEIMRTAVKSAKEIVGMGMDSAVDYVFHEKEAENRAKRRNEKANRRIGRSDDTDYTLYSKEDYDNDRNSANYRNVQNIPPSYYSNRDDAHGTLDIIQNKIKANGSISVNEYCELTGYRTQPVGRHWGWTKADSFYVAQQTQGTHAGMFALMHTTPTELDEEEA